MQLTDISPSIALTSLDGRYHAQTAALTEYLSEPALNRERMKVEAEWMILLANGFTGNGSKPVLDGVQPLNEAEQRYLRGIPERFGAEGIKRHAAYEAVTHHDVKAVEYYIDDELDQARTELGAATSLPDLKTLVHFACTSEDINNLAIARCVKNAVERIWLPAARSVADALEAMARRHRDLPLLSLTHGQPATPTTLGKELAVYVHRLDRQLSHIESQEYLGKFNGATGTFGAHVAARPDVGWIALSREFVANRIGLTWNPLTTQIESHDWQAELYGTISHTNRILHNLAVDVWMYISRGVFAQEPVKGATGSSTMPHKVNPIRFENAEANLELSCSLLDTLSATLVESRWQRDLTDSTTQRNIGAALGYSLLALNNLLGGLNSIHPNQVVIAQELDENWEVLGEPIQTAMRAAELAGRPGMDKPYEKVKELMRGRSISREDVERFIDSLSFDDATAARLKALTPAGYTGLAGTLVDYALADQALANHNQSDHNQSDYAAQ
jgi:adenylosuccinate lyase